jgi:hypothetical protein
MLLTLFANASAEAQQTGPTDLDPARSGLHFSIGVGAASLGATCDACTANLFEDRISGFSGVLQLGGAITPRLVVTGEFIGWIRNDEPLFRRVAGLSIAFLGYPSASSGFFVKGGAGGIRAIAEDDVLVIRTDAWMGTTGVGYDIPVRTNVMITPYVNYVRSFGGTTDINGVLSPVAVMPNAFQFGLALTVH